MGENENAYGLQNTINRITNSVYHIFSEDTIGKGKMKRFSVAFFSLLC